jgi:mannan endo-1,4-beta-mannosidase
VETEVLDQDAQMRPAKALLSTSFALLCLALAAPLRSQESSTSDDFVHVEGTHFQRRGMRVNLFGANVAVMHGPRHRAALESTLDAVRADGLSTIRLWAFGEQPSDAQPWARDYAFRIGEGADGWVEESFVHLDRALVLARERGLGVIVVLTNRWPDYGGIAQHAVWSGLPVERDADRSLAALSLPMFFGDLSGPSTYDAHVERIVTRTNSLSHIAYRDDPTIVAWELINESDVPSARHREALLNWTRESAHHIRALDPNHMISAGHIGYMNATQRATWLAVNALPEISYADAHAYPTAYGDVSNFRALDRFVDDHVQLAHHVLHKPFIWGEYGFSTAARRHRGRASPAWFDHFLDRSLFDDVDGALVWIYGTAQERLRPHMIDVDGEEHEGAFVRTRMQRLARDLARPRAANPLLAEAHGAASLWLAPSIFRGPLATRAIAMLPRQSTWRFGPERVHRIEGENAGFWQELPSPHIYVSGAGTITFRLTTRPATQTLRDAVVHLTFRASSELPGRGLGATDADGARIRVLVDDQVLGEAEVIADDGQGGDVHLSSSEPSLLAALQRRGRHTLRFVVLGGDLANGLCLYGAPQAPSIFLSIEPPISD